MLQQHSEIHISIVICCYNSAGRLARTLEHLAKQSCDGLNCEIVLVDNNSTDGTAENALNIWNDLGNPFSLRIVGESKAGQAYARETGVRQSSGRYIVFCDDDNSLAADYISTAYRLMEKHPEIGVLGGEGTAQSSMELPVWFDEVKNAYACGKQNDVSGVITKRGYVWGAGMVVRKMEMMILLESGFRSTLTGRTGVKLSSGDDSEICCWFVLLGKDLYYSESLQFGHFIEPYRLDRTYCDNLFLGFGHAAKALNTYFRLIELTSKKRQLNMLAIFGLLVRKIKNTLSNDDAITLEYYNPTSACVHQEAKYILSARKKAISLLQASGAKI